MPKHKVYNGVVPLYYVGHYLLMAMMAIYVIAYVMTTISGVGTFE